METKKVLSLIFSLLFVGAFTFVLVWGITNFNKVQEGLSGTGLYTQEDLNKAYEDGYDTVCSKIPESRVPMGKETEIHLYPYGCAKLRMTEIPKI